MTAAGDTGVPADLLEFNRTLRAAGGAQGALELLAGYDDYVNQDGPSVAEVQRKVPLHEVAGWRLTADVYRPHGPAPFPVLVWLHGGGWVLGAPVSHRRLAADLCALGLVVVMLDYRRAPKHRFPAAVDDTAYALGWARENAAQFGGDPERLLVGGDSAGGNLAAAALASGDGAGVRAALLAYGIYDVHRALSTGHVSDLVGGPDPDDQVYLEPSDARTLLDDPRLHPERFCAGFPPTLVLCGDEDPLYEESVSLAGALAAADVPHRFVTLDGTPHGFLQMPTHPSDAAALASIAEFVAANVPEA